MTDERRRWIREELLNLVGPADGTASRLDVVDIAIAAIAVAEAGPCPEGDCDRWGGHTGDHWNRKGNLYWSRS